MTWPVLLHPTTHLATDRDESAIDAWWLAWAGHALVTDPTTLFSAPVGYPEHSPVMARLVGLVPTGFLGTGTSAAILRYNILFVLSLALAAFGGYVLARQLGSRPLGSSVVAVAFAFAPWRLAQSVPLDVLCTGGVALCLAMLARGYGWSLRSRSSSPRKPNPRWIMGGWLVAAWQVTLGVDVGLPLAGILAITITVMVGNWLARRCPRPRWLAAVTTLAGAVVVASSAVGMAVAADTLAHATRVEEVSEYSVSLWGLFTAPAESLLWGSLHESARNGLANADQGGAALSGLFLLALALTGLVVSLWRWQQRLWMVMGTGVAIVLAMGSYGPDGGWMGFLSLWKFVPGFAAVDNPSAMMVWVTLLLSLLAAGAVDALAVRVAAVARRLDRIERVCALRAASQGRHAVPGRRARLAGRVALRAALFLPLGLVLAESVPALTTDEVPQASGDLLTALAEADGPTLVLPTGQEQDAATLLWSVQDFPLLANSDPATASEALVRAWSLAPAFPSADSVEAFDALGVRTVVVLRSEASRSGYVSGVGEVDQYLVSSLDLRVEATDDVLVFTLSST